MYILEPVSHKTIWGGNKLQKYSVDNAEHLGHLYMVNGHEGLSNKIVNGQDKGKTLKDVFAENKDSWNMAEYEEFPLTIALVDATANLSIQVHPDDVTAKQLENKRLGKKESWIFLEPPKKGWIYAGCTCMEKEGIKQCIAEKKMENIAEHLKVEKDAYVCISAGTLHAMTAGSLVYEIEYGSDFTYRFYDYDRRDSNGMLRELQLDKALLAIKPEVVPRVEKTEDFQWISEEHYEVCRLKNTKGYRNTGIELECVSVIEGQGVYEGVEIKSGMTFLILPGEKIPDVMINQAIAARIR